MAAPSLKKIAYHTLQQGKTLAGLAHKELSTKLMEVFAPEASPCLLYTSPSPRDKRQYRMPSSA